MKIVKNIFSIRLANDVIRGLIIFTILLLTSCAVSRSSMYDSDSPLTKEIAEAKTLQLKIRIPQGWFTAEENENNLIDLWLIKDDYSATLNFVTLNLDSATVKEISSDEINGLVRLSELFRKAKFGKSIQKFSNQEIFEINKKQFAAYEYEDSSKRLIRVVVFSYGSKYYELSAIPVKTQNLQELYKIQNSILSSID
ncbi:MAG: hypothetical protein NTX65_07460 [Ignavibacteriales bacterium]|nr:hypothetical protein [Ignavibacteriales bacterium]